MRHVQDNCQIFRAPSPPVCGNVHSYPPSAFRVSWFCTDSVEDCLITELKGSGRSAGPLRSQTIITDDIWYRIGFVWDGSHRILSVDNMAVAEDAQNGLEGSSNGRYIDTSKMMQSGTDFSGLIDDIRIYNRVVHP